jgi:type II secretion system protein C
MPLPLLFVLLAAVPPADISASGVVLAGSPERSVAVLRVQGQSRVVRAGEAAFGGTVVAVAADKVTLDYGGERIDVRVRSGAGAYAAAARPANEDPRSPAKTMMRTEVQRRIGEEQARILSETAIAPVSGSNGQIQGFAITKLPAGGSLLGDVGLQPGDVITEINGTAVDSLPTLISLWPRLQNESQIRATVLRDGQPVTITVSLK